MKPERIEDLRIIIHHMIDCLVEVESAKSTMKLEVDTLCRIAIEGYARMPELFELLSLDNSIGKYTKSN